MPYQHWDAPVSVPVLRAILLQRFVMSGVAYTGEGDEEDPYEHVASILTNVSRLKEARVLLLQPGRGTLQALVAQLQAPGVTRRQGVAGTLRNCCMTAEVSQGVHPCAMHATCCPPMEARTWRSYLGTHVMCVCRTCVCTV